MNIAPIGFVDRDRGDQAVVLVRVMDDLIGLGLLLKRNGDIEVDFGADELHRVMDAFQAARLAVRRS